MEKVCTARWWRGRSVAPRGTDDEDDDEDEEEEWNFNALTLQRSSLDKTKRTPDGRAHES